MEPDFPDPHGFMPDGCGFKALREAGRVFRTSNRFISNYAAPVWQRVAACREYSSDYLAVADLIKQGRESGHNRFATPFSQ